MSLESLSLPFRSVPFPVDVVVKTPSSGNLANEDLSNHNFEDNKVEVLRFLRINWTKQKS
jgi:hypothetical protein